MVITERQDGLLIVGTEGRALEVDFEHGQQTANQGDISYHKRDAMRLTFVLLQTGVFLSHNLPDRFKVSIKLKIAFRFAFKKKKSKKNLF